MRPALKVLGWCVAVLAISGFAALCYGIAYANWSPIWGPLDILLFLAAALGALMGILPMGNLNKQFPGFAPRVVWMGTLMFGVAMILFVPLALLGGKL